MSKYGISTVESGYDDNFWAKYEEEKKKLKEESKPRKEKEEDLFSLLLFFLPEVNKRRLIIIIIWSILYKLFLDYGYGIVYFMFTLIAYMFFSVSKRKPGEKSAYSVFNENCERLPGTLTSQSILGMFGGPVYENENPEDEIEEEEEKKSNIQAEDKPVFNSNGELQKRQLKSSAKMPLNSLCKCGSKKKYKSCCIKLDAKCN